MWGADHRALKDKNVEWLATRHDVGELRLHMVAHFDPQRGMPDDINSEVGYEVAGGGFLGIEQRNRVAAAGAALQPEERSHDKSPGRASIRDDRASCSRIEARRNCRCPLRRPESIPHGGAQGRKRNSRISMTRAAGSWLRAQLLGRWRCRRLIRFQWLEGVDVSHARAIPCNEHC